MAQATIEHRNAEADLWIAGHVFGDVDAEQVTVAHGAVVDGNIEAGTVTIYGRVTGLVRAPSIILGPSAVIEGELCYDDMSVAPGAVIAAHTIAA